MWLLILLLLAGDLVIGYCWWRERQAHARSRRALHFWRDYRVGSKRHAQPTVFPSSLMDTEDGQAAVRGLIQAKVAEHKGRRRDEMLR